MVASLGMPTLASLRKDLRLLWKYHFRHPVESHPAREEELGLVELPFDAAAYVAGLEARASPRFSVRRELEVDYRRRVYPMVTLRSEADAQATLLVVAGIHGNERAGLLAIPEILARFDAGRGVRLVVVTPANPVGAAHLSRYNAHGYDINRDFLRFETAEARALAQVYARERPDFVVSLHEGPQDATFMFGNRWVDAQLAHDALAALAAGGTTLATRDYFGLRLPTPGYAPSSRASRAVHRLWERWPGMMATIQFSEARRIPEIVLESSWRKADAEARIRPHVDLVAAVVEALAGRPGGR